MALDFPSTPTTGQAFVGSNGVAYYYTGSTWRISAASTSYTGPTPIYVTRCTRSSNLSVSNSTDTLVTFDTNTYDDLSAHNLTSNTSRIVVPAGMARVRLTGRTTWASNGTGARWGLIIKNGAGAMVSANSVASWSTPVGAAGNESSHNFDTGWIPCTAGDYFEMWVAHSAGGSLNLLGPNFGAWTGTYFQAEFSSGTLTAPTTLSSPFGRADVVPTLSEFAWVNQGGALATQHNYGVNFYCPGGTTNLIRGLVKAVPASTPYRIRARLRFAFGFKNFLQGGIGWYDGTAVQVTNIASESGQTVHRTRNYTNPTTHSSDPFGIIGAMHTDWYGLYDDGTTRYFQASADGDNWINIFSTPRTTFLTPTHAGFFVVPENSGSPTLDLSMTVMSWEVS